MPKQFARIFPDRTLFQMCLERNAPLCEKRMIVSNEEHYFLALDQMEEIFGNSGDGEASFMLEPVGRNTAPAITLASLTLDSDEIVLVTPSDHIVEDEESYAKAVGRAVELAGEGHIVTFGITPSYAETGFGYIEADGESVRAFHEKPDAETAKRYLEKGDFFWNSGMFCFRVSTLLEEMRKYAPEILESSIEAVERASAREPLRIGREDMLSIPEESIDYAVIEKSGRIRMVEGDFGWSDLGSFDALADHFESDENGNSIGEKLVYLGSSNNFVYGSDRTITLCDVDDLVVVDTDDALLITKKGSTQRVKEIVSALKERGSDLTHVHVTAHRPWGNYTVLEDSERYKIKRIVVKPGKRLSLQKHFHRSEHWIVVSGTALVRVGDEEKIVRANESVYIPMGQLHRLDNPGRIPLVLVEAQVGEYTGEDDIVRIEDDYERA